MTPVTLQVYPLADTLLPEYMMASLTRSTNPKRSRKSRRSSKRIWASARSLKILCRNSSFRFIVDVSCVRDPNVEVPQPALQDPPGRSGHARRWVHPARCRGRRPPVSPVLQPSEGGVFDGEFGDAIMMSGRQQYSFELIRPRPTGYLRLLLNQAEILFTPYVFRIVEEGNERQVGLADLR